MLIIIKDILIQFIKTIINYKKIFIKYKIIILILINHFIILIELNQIKKLKQLKVCICTVGKNENKYIKEYVEYYKSYGIDKIFLYDNNNINGEHFENIIFNFINQGFVELKNWRGIKSPQKLIYNDCYKNNYNIYDWLIFNDIDEFLYLKNYNNIKDFLNRPKFKNCQSIQLNWLLLTDNNLLYYENKSLIKRFTEKDPYMKKRKISKYSNGKSILRGNITNIKIFNFHCISNKIKSCDGFGRNVTFNKPDYKYYYFKHYYCKSTEEFIEKLKKGDVYKLTNKIKIQFYFSYNKITYEKLNYIEKELGIKLKDYKDKINIKKNIK